MRFSLAATLAMLAGQALATPSATHNEITRVKRDLATISSAVNAVNSAAASFDAAVKAYSGGDISSLASSAENVLETTQSSTQTVAGTSDISENDAVSLQPLVMTLTATVNSTVNDLIAKKSQLIAAGAGGIVEGSLQAQQSAASNFSQAITSKVPQALQSLASQLSSGIASSLQDGVNAFAGAGGSSPTATSSGSGMATATGAMPTWPTTGGNSTTAPIPPFAGDASTASVRSSYLLFVLLSGATMLFL